MVSNRGFGITTIIITFIAKVLSSGNNDKCSSWINTSPGGTQNVQYTTISSNEYQAPAYEQRDQLPPFSSFFSSGNSSSSGRGTWN